MHLYGIVDKDLEEQTRSLLGRGLGDQRVLEQIHRAAVNGELVSNAERSYVSTLIAKHAIPKDSEQSQPEPEPAETKPASVRQQQKSSGGNIKFAVIAAAVAAGIAVAALALSGGAPEDPGYGIQLDSDVYGTGGFIEIQGTTDPDAGSAIRLQILDASGRVVWSEMDVEVDGNGVYHTLVLAGGTGWEPGGHTLEAVHGSLVYVAEFEFDG